MNLLPILLFPIWFLFILIIIIFIYVFLASNSLVSILSFMVYIILLLPLYYFLERLRKYIIDTGLRFLSIFNFIYYLATVMNIFIGVILFIMVLYHLVLNP